MESSLSKMFNNSAVDPSELVSYDCFVSKMRIKIFEHYVDELLFRGEILKSELKSRNVTLSATIARDIKDFKNVAF